MLSEGVSFDEIIKVYPVLSAEDIRAAIAYGAEMTRERIVDIKPDVMKEMVGGMVRALAENEVKDKLWIIEPVRIRIHEPFEQ